jgi:hypothetical protein
MGRLLPVFLLLYTAIMVFTVVDIAVIERSRVRYLPKWGWILLVIFTTILGTILWFALGRERRGGGGGRRRAVAPDDDPGFLRDIQRQQFDAEQADRIRDLERQLKDLDDEVIPGVDARPAEGSDSGAVNPGSGAPGSAGAAPGAASGTDASGEPGAEPSSDRTADPGSDSSREP